MTPTPRVRTLELRRPDTAARAGGACFLRPKTAIGDGPAICHHPTVDGDIANPAKRQQAAVAVDILNLANNLASAHEPAQCLRSRPAAGPWGLLAHAHLSAFGRIDAEKPHFPAGEPKTVAVDHKSTAHKTFRHTLFAQSGKQNNRDRDQQAKPASTLSKNRIAQDCLSKRPRAGNVNPKLIKANQHLRRGAIGHDWVGDQGIGGLVRQFAVTNR